MSRGGPAPGRRGGARGGGGGAGGGVGVWGGGVLVFFLFLFWVLFFLVVGKMG